MEIIQIKNAKGEVVGETILMDCGFSHTEYYDDDYIRELNRIALIEIDARAERLEI